MRKIIYAGLLIGLATASTEGRAAGAEAELKAAQQTRQNIEAALGGVKSGFKGLFSGVFGSVQKMVTDMNSVTANVNATSQGVEKALPGEYAAITSTSNSLVTQLKNLPSTCGAKNPLCNNTLPAEPGSLSVQDYLDQLSETAIPKYQKAIKSLPTSANLEAGVAIIQKAVDSLDAGDQQKLTTLSHDIYISQTNLSDAIQEIDGILNNIVQASMPH